MNNKDIRLEASEAGLKLWQIAERLGIADCNFSRKLRKELPETQKAKIRKIITELRDEVMIQ